MNSTQIATVATGIISLIQTGQEIYRAAADAMDSIEKQAALAGKDKKTWVLDYMKNEILKGEGWDRYWFTILSDFIDKIKAAYNLVKDLINK